MGDEHDLVPGPDEATDEAVEHGLGAAVRRRGNRQPGGAIMPMRIPNVLLSMGAADGVPARTRRTRHTSVSARSPVRVTSAMAGAIRAARAAAVGYPRDGGPDSPSRTTGSTRTPPRQPWTQGGESAPLGDPAERVMLLAGQTFCLSDGAGDVRPELPHGLFVGDTRVLSRHDLRSTAVRSSRWASPQESGSAATLRRSDRHHRRRPSAPRRAAAHPRAVPGRGDRAAEP